MPKISIITPTYNSEGTIDKTIDALKMIKDNGFGIYTLDKELQSRAYTAISVG